MTVVANLDGRKRRWLKWAIGALGVVAVAALLVAQISPVIQPVTYDEAFCTYDAYRVFSGQVPFKDFFNFVPAGTYYLLAGAMAIAKDRPETAARCTMLAAVAFAWLAAYCILRRTGGCRFPAGAVSAVLPVSLFPFAPFAPHHWFGTGAYFAAILVVGILWEGRDGWAWWVGAGLLASLAGWCLQTEGLLALSLINLSALGTSRDWRAMSRKLLFLWCGVLAGSVVLWSPILWFGGAREAWRDLILWPLHNYRQVGNQNDSALFGDLPWRYDLLLKTASDPLQPAGPLAALTGGILYVLLVLGALACVGMALYATALILLRRRPPATRLMAFSLTTILSASLFIKLHPTWVHFIYAFVSVFMLWAALAAGRWADSRGQRAVWVTASAVLLVSGIVYHGRGYLGRVPQGWEYTDVDRVDRESPLNRSIRSLEILKPGDTIAVFPTGGNVYLYTYPAAVGYTYFCALEDRYNDRRDHQTVAEQIEKNKPKAVFIHRVKAAAFLDDGGPVATVLQRDYELAGGSPTMVMLVRKGGGS